MDKMIIAITIIAVFCIVTIKLFTKDNKHDLEIQAGKFKFTIKKHD